MSSGKVKEIIFLGTGSSSTAPDIVCLTEPEIKCTTCLSTLKPEGAINIRKNTCLLIRFHHGDGGIRNIIIDCGKTFYESAIKFWPIFKLRRIDAVVLTHPHADAINGLDDLRSWTLNKAIQEYIPIYLTENTLENIKSSFPYLVDKKKSSGGGDLPSFQWNIIDSHTNFTVEGLEFTPLQEDTFIKLHGSELIVLDSLNRIIGKPHKSHFSIYEAVDVVRKLNPIPKKAFIVGLSHSIEYYDLVREMKELQEKEPDLYVRPAHDGLNIKIEELSA
ncbi:8834_t:CDS:2 [Entrophospora sp. SA101]|nr:8834_t:CDS:2 [Entrophospora sp. SA101]